MYKNNVFEIERKENDTWNPHYIPYIRIPPVKNLLY